uniref:Uncharacterized protein n=1 Tax=Oryza punctata TaxID=4537 RepID=A0A0E0K377_ORYPU
MRNWIRVDFPIPVDDDEPSVSLAPNTSCHPQHAGSAAGSRRSHLAVLHVGHSDGRRAGALYATTNHRPLEAIPASLSLRSLKAIAARTSFPMKLARKFFELEMTVQDCDLDQYGVVNNTVYPSYIERAREELMSGLGMSRTSIACTGNAMALTELNIKYFTPLIKRGEKFVVRLSLGRIKGARISAEQFIERLPDRKLVVESTATIICFNRKHRPTRVWPELSSKLLDYFQED